MWAVLSVARVGGACAVGGAECRPGPVCAHGQSHGARVWSKDDSDTDAGWMMTPTDNDSGKGTYGKASPSTGTPAATFCAQSGTAVGQGRGHGSRCRLRACVGVGHGSVRKPVPRSEGLSDSSRVALCASVPRTPGGRAGADPSRRGGTAVPSGATRRWGSGSPADAAGGGYVGGWDAH